MSILDIFNCLPLNVKVGEKSVSVQIGMNLTIVGSKELPK